MFARDGPHRGQRSRGEAGDLAPGGEAGLHALPVLRGGEEVPTGAEVIRDRTERTEELLRVRGRLEALEDPFSSPCRAVGVLRPDGVPSAGAYSVGVSRTTGSSRSVFSW
jgi:hypothetical protein